jgi:hypothetical protein
LSNNKTNNKGKLKFDFIKLYVPSAKPFDISGLNVTRKILPDVATAFDKFGNDLIIGSIAFPTDFGKLYFMLVGKFSIDFIIIP